MGRPRKSAQAAAAAAAADNTTVLDVKPIKTLAPMFPAALGFHTATPGPNSPNFMCVTPFGTPNAESGSNPPGFTPGQMPPPMFFMGGAGAGTGTAGVTTPVVPPVLITPKSKKTPAGSTGQGKKRRGRPRKSEAAAIVTPVQIVVSPPASIGQGKRGRGRPRKSEQIVA